MKRTIQTRRVRRFEHQADAEATADVINDMDEPGFAPCFTAEATFTAYPGAPWVVDLRWADDGTEAWRRSTGASTGDFAGWVAA